MTNKKTMSATLMQLRDRLRRAALSGTVDNKGLARVRRLIDGAHTGMGVVLIRPNGPQGRGKWKIIACNSTYCSMNRFSKAGLIGKEINILNAIPEDREQYWRRLRAMPTCIDVIHKTGPLGGGAFIHVKVATCKLKIGDKEFVLGMDKDITAEAQTESAANALGATLHFAANCDSLKQTLNTIAKGTQDALHCDAVTLYMYDKETRLLSHPPVWVGVRFPDRLVRLGVVLPGSFIYQVLKRNDMYASENPLNDKLFRKSRFTADEKIKAVVAIPLRPKPKYSVGVMFINYRTQHVFSENELLYIQLFAGHAAMAISNIQLIDKLRKANVLLRDLFDPVRGGL